MSSRYRFLFLNGSNARPYELYLMSKTTGLKGPAMWVVTNDQGYLDTAQMIDPNVKPGKLAIMPGEGYEIIVDFTGLAGQVIERRNTARTPYVGGAPVHGNTTGKIIQFQVNFPAVADTSFVPAAGAPVRATAMKRLVDVNLAAVPPTSAPAPGVTIHKYRRLTVNEVIGAGGPLEVLVNNTLYDQLARLAEVKGAALADMPEVAFITVHSKDGLGHHYTLLHNKAFSNITRLFGEAKRRLPGEDSVTLVEGFLGAYPNAFFVLREEDLPDFVDTVAAIKTEADYRTKLMARYAIRRTDPRFWPHSDALHAGFREQAGVEAGLFDYNRFENR